MISWEEYLVCYYFSPSWKIVKYYNFDNLFIISYEEELVSSIKDYLDTVVNIFNLFIILIYLI